MITDIRLRSQQLVNPAFDDPKETLWHGWVHCRDREYSMAKWAVGLRLKKPDIRKVEADFGEGGILRTHVLRPTWHLVVAEDIRWMLKLSVRRVKLAYDSYWKNHGISEELYIKGHDVIVRVLEGNRYLTRQEIGEN